MGVTDAAPSHFLYPHSTSMSTLIEAVQGYNHSLVNRRLRKRTALGSMAGVP